MSEKVSTADVRLRIGDMLNRVALRQDEFVIERKGKPMAALVSVERLEQLRRVARSGLREFLEAQASGEVSAPAAMTLALEAQHWARSHPRKPRRTR